MPKAQCSLFKGKTPAKDRGGGGGVDRKSDGDAVDQYLRILTKWEKADLTLKKVDALLSLMRTD